MLQGLSQLGAHTFIWSPAFEGIGAETAAHSAAAAGLGAIEIPLLDPSRIDVPAAVETLARHRLRPTCSLGLPADKHAPDNPDGAVQFLRSAIDTASALGAEWLTGALYGHLGQMTGCGATDEELGVVAEVLRIAADHAATREVRLGIEVINRYETYLVNTAEQLLELLDEVNRPATVFGHLDTFHMSIEEPDVAAAVRLLGDRLGYVHLAESNRGAIGTGLFPFDELFSALHQIDFNGPAVMEAFINASDDLRSATASWRPVAGTPERFVETSLDHLAPLLRSGSPSPSV
jgi:D-psicose/D-tagatose/L-ribulose 3-epimerase